MFCRLMASVIVLATCWRLSAEPALPSEFPFEFREGLVWVLVTVPQSADPLNFLIDSGAGASVINLRTAKRLGVRLGQRVDVHGVGGSAEGFWSQRLAVTASGVALKGVFGRGLGGIEPGLRLRGGRVAGRGLLPWARGADRFRRAKGSTAAVERGCRRRECGRFEDQPWSAAGSSGCQQRQVPMDASRYRLHVGVAMGRQRGMGRDNSQRRVRWADGTGNPNHQDHRAARLGKF
ncbi:MAG: hypothetical protein DME25_20030 [Verrucomicrobia bacterium]|nr:MAG: hypothetical protein DME25_20030 [Verrucomicrobiota bacterium]